MRPKASGAGLVCRTVVGDDDDDDDDDGEGERWGGPAASDLPVGDHLQQESPGHAGGRQAWHVRRSRRLVEHDDDRRYSQVPAEIQRVLRQVDSAAQTRRQSVAEAVQQRNVRGTDTSSVSVTFPPPMHAKLSCFCHA